jgi:hypothetical protein
MSAPLGGAAVSSDLFVYVCARVPVPVCLCVRVCVRVRVRVVVLLGSPAFGLWGDPRVVSVLVALHTRVYGEQNDAVEAIGNVSQKPAHAQHCSTATASLQ